MFYIEIEQDRELKASCFEIIQHLRIVNCMKRLDGLQFHNQFMADQKVKLRLPHWMAFIL